MENLILFILLALLSEILGTIGGFGSSMFFVPIAGYFLDFHSVLGITAVFHVLSNLTKIAFFREGFDKRLILYLGIPAVLFVIAGSFLSRFFRSESLEIVLAIFLIGLSLVFLFKGFIVKPSKPNAIAGGVLSGFVAGLLGTGGAIRGIVLAAYNLEKGVFIATSAIIDLAIDSGRSLIYFMNGYIHGHDLYLIPILFVLSVAGTYIGKLVLKHVSQERFRVVVLVMILITGLITLFKVLN